jgi:hypothetical protein
VPGAGLEVADDPEISGEWYALRRVHPNFVKQNTGEPDSSVFKDDAGGVGTSVTLWRSAADLENVTRDYEAFGVVAVRVQAFRDEQLGIMFTFEDGNPNHCEVFGPRTSGKQKRIRGQARWVKYPQGYPDEFVGDLFQLPEG